MSSPPPNPSSSQQAPSPEFSSASEDAPREDCTNCGTSLTGTYCAVCGQRAANRVVPLWQVGNEFLEDLFDLDLCILNTLPTFFFRPGRLTVEYVHGRRRTYVRPLRLYLFSSFLLFTVLALTSAGALSFSFNPISDDARAELHEARTELDALRTSLAAQQSPPDGPAPQDASSPHSQAEIAGLDAALSSVDSALANQGQVQTTLPLPVLVERLNVPNAPAPETQTKILHLLNDPGELLNDLIDWAPYLMFLLVPTFALLLKGLYLRQKRLYLEHLIFALHVHALAFIAFSISAGLAALGLGASISLNWWLAVSPFGYLFFALRHVYGQSLLSTLNKMTALLLVYGIILVAGVVLLVVLTVYLM